MPRAFAAFARGTSFLMGEACMSAHLLLIAVILLPFENPVEKYIYRHIVIILRYSRNAKMVDNIYIRTHGNGERK